MTCEYCGREMTPGVSCTEETVTLDDQPFARLRYGEERRGGGSWLRGDRPCHDCATPPGGLHHWGCDVEECPRCGNQAISCGCGEDAAE